MKKTRIPRTDSIEELARFWDTHDLTDVEEELEEVHEPVFEREARVSIHLPSREAEEIQRIARARGVAPSELLREWVLNKVHSS